MTLKEYIKQNKIPKDTFISLHNKDNKWIICDVQDSARLINYLDLTVLDDTNNSENIRKKIVRVLKLDYEPAMSIESIKHKEEQRQVITAKKSRK